MNITPYSIAERYLGVHEFIGDKHNPIIVGWIHLAGGVWYEADEISWCGAFVHLPAYELDLSRPPRFGGLSARKWLTVGEPIELADAVSGFDVVVYKRGGPDQPPASVIDAPGHVNWFSSLVDDGDHVDGLGGNQSNKVSVIRKHVTAVLGVRRLFPRVK